MEKFMEILKKLDEKLTTFVEQKEKDIEGLREEVRKLEKQFLRALAQAQQTEPSIVNKRVAFAEGQEELAQKFLKFANAVFVGDQATVKTMTEGVDEDGGYLVPEEFRATLIRLITAYGDARKLGTVIPMSKDELRIPRLVSGVSVYWVGEAQDIPTTKPSLDRVSLVAKKLAALVPVSSELLEDSSIAIANLLMQLFAEAMAQEEDRVAFVGNPSSGDPFAGVLYTSGVNVHQISGNNFTDVTADDLLKLITLVPSAAAKNGVFLAHRSIIHHLYGLKDNNGQYIVRKPTDKEPATLWGYPIVQSDVMPDVSASAADTPFIAFGDFAQLYIGDRRKLSIAQSQHVGFVSDTVYLRATERVAFAVAIPDAFAIAKTAS